MPKLDQREQHIARTLIGQLAGANPVRVSSRCPTTSRQISLTVTADGPGGIKPAETIVSFLLPDGEFGATIIGRFCRMVDTSGAQR